MGRRASAPEAAAGRDQPADPGPGPGPRPGPQTPPGTTLEIGPILALTVRHFFPEFNGWLEQLPDPRFEPFVEYGRKFLFWWGVALSLLKLGSRRQLDFQLNSDGPCVLANLNRLAGTRRKT